jgi:TRAP-type uncharacterized transport system substrate-binding protein
MLSISLAVVGNALAADVDATLGGGSPHGMFSIVGEAVTEAVRREYPGSSFSYESGNNAGSLLRMLRGDIAFSMAAPGEIEAALNGERPFPAKFEKRRFGMVARLLDGLVGYVAVSAEFVDRYDLDSLADLQRKKVPVRLSTNQLGNLSTARFGRELLSAYGIDEALINAWGGKDYHLPNSASFDLTHGEASALAVVTQPMNATADDRQTIDVEIRDRTEVHKMRVREVTDEQERQRLWDISAETFPPYNDYQAKTSRRIPVFLAEPV